MDNPNPNANANPNQVPVFCCDELQTPQSMPMFLSRKALQEAWVVSGRKLSELPQQAPLLSMAVLTMALLAVATLTTMASLTVAITYYALAVMDLQP